MRYHSAVAGSLVATGTFIFAGALVVYLVNHLTIGKRHENAVERFRLRGGVRDLHGNLRDNAGGKGDRVPRLFWRVGCKLGPIAGLFPGMWLEPKDANAGVGAGFSLPRRGDLSAKLILGAAIFGAGRGLDGFCPGPALTSRTCGAVAVVIFRRCDGAVDVLHS
jgi:uncharacterized membrane protein YedE/YeeE